MTEAAPAAGATARRRLWLTAVTGISQAVGFLSVALLGLLIASKFGSSAATDGFFIAQSVYAIVLLVGQSLRTTSVGELARDPQRSISETLGAIGLLALLASVFFAILTFALVPVLTSDLPAVGTHSAQESLLLLWPAAAFQLLAGALAAILATRDRVAFAAMAYSVAALAGLLCFVPFSSWFGTTSLPLVLVVTSAFAAGLMGFGVVRWGGLQLHRPGLKPAFGRARSLLVGAVGLIVGQVIVASSVGLAGQVGEHAATTYSYGMMAISVVMATAVTPAMIVLAPVMATEWDGRTDSLAAFALRVFRFGVFLVVPAVAGIALIGGPVLSLLINEQGRDTVPDIITVVLILAPTTLATLMVMIPELGLLTKGRFSVVARVALAVVALHLVVSTAVVLLDGGLFALALVSTLTATLSASLIVAIGTGPERGRAFGGFGVALLQLVLPAVLAYVAAALVFGTHVDELGRGIAAWVAGSVLAGGWLLTTRRAEIMGLVEMVTARGGPVPPEPSV